MRAVAALALLLALAGAAYAQDVAPKNALERVEPKGRPAPSTTLRDVEFGVTTRQFGLQRRVEMLQWQRQADGYRKVWNSGPLDSSGFDAAHANSGAFPLRTRYWIATDVRLDGRPVDEDVLKTFGAWRVFRPGFSALPGNLSATFQPDGDGLSSAENPLDPQIGDLRVTWRELTLPALRGRVALERGSWVPVQGAASAPQAVSAVTTQSVAPSSGPLMRERWMIGAGVALLALVAWLALRRRARRRR